MTVFWFSAAGLVALALAFVFFPLFRRSRASRPTTDPDSLNIAVIRQQLQELEADLETGRLDRDQFEAAKLDLEKELIDDLSLSKAAPASDGSSRRRWTAALLGISVPLLAVLLYQYLGSIDRLELFRTAARPPAAPATGVKELPPMEVLVERLAERLREQPDNVQGWLMLGRSYGAIGRPSEALEAYASAYRLAPDNVEVLTAYAAAMAETQGGQLAGRPTELLGEALRIEPDHPDTLFLLGLSNFQQQRYAQAIERWQTLAARMSPGSEDFSLLTEYIGEARQRAGMGEASPEAEPELAAAEQSNTAESAALSSASVRVQVSLDPALRSRLSGDETVFVFARALKGPRMPLAAARRQVRDLPLALELDDSMAMVPAMRLSSFPEVVVGARVSISGDPVPRSGDLQGEVSPVSTSGAETIRVSIDQVVP